MSDDSTARPVPMASVSSKIPPGAGPHQGLRNDVHLLIEYLGRHRPGRVDACFEDSRGDMSRPAGVPIAPRTEAGQEPTKAGFLHRWAAISKTAEGEEPKVEDLVFLLAARDFLASLALPATVDSIRLTSAYVGETGEAADIDWIHGDRLRGLAKLLRAVCVALVLLTVAVSLVAFGGKRLLEEQDRMLAFLGSVTSEIGAEQRPTTPAAAPVPTGRLPQAPGAVERAFQFAYCDVPFMDARGAVHFISPRQESLCNRLWGINRVVNQLNTNLEAWGNFGPTSYGMRVTGLSSNVADGRVRVFAEAARPLNLREALLLLPERNPAREDQGPPVPPAPDLSAARQMVDDAHFEFFTRQYRGERHRVTDGTSPTQAKVMIEALSLYIMPCLYALLGAFVAMFQQLKRRADSFTLDRSDGAQAIQTLVFGLVFGALVGILADMMRTQPASGAASDEVVLGVSVIALIAGYSVAHVFRFLDNFADRVFGAAPQPRAGPG